MKRIVLMVLSLALCTAFAGEKLPSFETGAIALLTSEQDTSRRTGGSAEELGDYLLKLKSAGAAYLSEAKDVPKVSGAYVVVVKPGKRSRIWVHLITEQPHQEFADALASALQSVEPLSVVEGPIAVSVSFRTWPKGALPMPFAGIAALYQGIEKPSGSVNIDALIKLAWPDDENEQAYFPKTLPYSLPGVDRGAHLTESQAIDLANYVAVHHRKNPAHFNPPKATYENGEWSLHFESSEPIPALGSDFSVYIYERDNTFSFSPGR